MSKDKSKVVTQVVAVKEVEGDGVNELVATLTATVDEVKNKLEVQDGFLAQIPAMLENQNAQFQEMMSSLMQPPLYNSEGENIENQNTENYVKNLVPDNIFVLGEKSMDTPQLDDELEVVLKQLEVPDEYGNDLSVRVAATFTDIIQNDTSKEMSEKIMSLYKTPGNCKLLTVPKVNPEIWNALNSNARAVDAKFQMIIAHATRSIVAQARAMDMLISSSMPILEKKELLSVLVDGASAMGSVVKDLNNKRKKLIRPLLDESISSICAQKLPVTTLLFGDNLEQDLKVARGASKMKLVRNQRPMPYQFPRGGNYRFQAPRQMTNPLNFNGNPQRLRAPGGFQFHRPARAPHSQGFNPGYNPGYNPNRHPFEKKSQQKMN